MNPTSTGREARPWMLLAVSGAAAVAVVAVAIVVPTLHSSAALQLQHAVPAPAARFSPTPAAMTPPSAQSTQASIAAGEPLGGPAPVAVGGGPRNEDPSTFDADVPLAPPGAGSPSVAGAAGEGERAKPIPVPHAVEPGAVGGVTGALVAAPASSGAASTTRPAAAIGGGSASAGSAEGAGGDAGVSSAGVGAAASGGGGMTGNQPAAGDAGGPGIFPVYGAPPASAPSGPPVVNGSAGSNAPLYTGGGGFSSTGSSTNNAVVDPHAQITASVMMSMAQGDDPERVWSGLSPFMRGGDLFVARVNGDDSTSTSFVAWSDRVRVDTPLVSYFVTVGDPQKLKAFVTRGLPATLTGVGLSTVDGFDLPTLVAISTSVHAAGKRLFVSASSSSRTVSLADIGARADVVELVIASTDPAGAATEANLAIGQLRGAASPSIFVRLPVATSAATMITLAQTITQRTTNVGVSLPYGTSANLLSDLRAAP